MQIGNKTFQKQLFKAIRIGVVGFIIAIILIQSIQLSSSAAASTTTEDVIPKPSIHTGSEFYQAAYRGIKEQYMPYYDQLTDPKMQKWGTTADIETGLALLLEIYQLNLHSESLLQTFLGNATKKHLVQVVFSDLSNVTDLWWGTFDKTIQAAGVLYQLGVINDTISQLNELLNYSLQLADYYATIAPKEVIVGNITVPGWTQLTLFDLLSYRVNSFISSKTISFDKSSDSYYERLDQAIDLGLVSLKSLNLVPLNDEIVAGRNLPATEFIDGANSEQNYTYQQSYYSDIEQGSTNEYMPLNIPTFQEALPNLLNQSDYYQNKLENYHVPAKLSVATTDAIPDKLISYQNYKMHLIYYSNSELVTYNVTIPHNSWSYDANGSLVYITNNTIETRSYYKPVDGAWTDNYTFVPTDPVTRGMWVWNTSLMAKPDSYRISLSIPNYTSDEQTFSTERVQGDTITYSATLPIEASNVNHQVKVTIEQLSDIAEQANGTQTNQEKLAELWNKTTELNGQIYYFESGNISQTLGADGYPIGGVPVNQSILEQMAQEPTYSFNTSYVPLTNVNYSLTITIPQFVMVSYKVYSKSYIYTINLQYYSYGSSISVSVSVDDSLGNSHLSSVYFYDYYNSGGGSCNPC